MSMRVCGRVFVRGCAIFLLQPPVLKTSSGYKLHLHGDLLLTTAPTKMNQTWQDIGKVNKFFKYYFSKAFFNFISVCWRKEVGEFTTVCYNHVYLRVWQLCTMICLMMGQMPVCTGGAGRVVFDCISQKCLFIYDTPIQIRNIPVKNVWCTRGMNAWNDRRNKPCVCELTRIIATGGFVCLLFFFFWKN